MSGCLKKYPKFLLGMPRNYIFEHGNPIENAIFTVDCHDVLLCFFLQ